MIPKRGNRPVIHPIIYKQTHFLELNNKVTIPNLCFDKKIMI